MYAWQFCKMLYIADRHGWARFVSMQNHYNLLYREEEREMTGLCLEEGIGLIPWSPLARGKLARPWEDAPTTKRAETDEFGKTLYAKNRDADKRVVDRLGEVAEQRGDSRAAVALAWLMQQPGVTAPIVGASKPGHLEQAAAALDIKLSPEEMARLGEAYEPHAVAGFS